MEAAITILYQASQLMLIAAVVLILYRFSRGVSVFDRVVAFETIGLAVVGYLLLESNATTARHNCPALHRCSARTGPVLGRGNHISCLFSRPRGVSR